MPELSTPENNNPLPLERFRDPIFPFLYWVREEGDIKQVIENETKEEFGLETGFGSEPTNLETKLCNFLSG